MSDVVQQTSSEDTAAVKPPRIPEDEADLLARPTMAEDARFVDLEVKVAFLEKLVSDLDASMFAMSQQIEGLKLVLVRLRRLEEDNEPPHLNEKPPHY